MIAARAAWLVVTGFACTAALAQSSASDTDESAYTPSTLVKIMGGTARSQNDEAELASAGQWFTTTATFTGQKRQPSSRFRPLISSWLGSRGLQGDMVDMFFGGELPELQFEQGGKKYWVMAGLPGGLGFDVYPPGQKLSIYLQRVGFATGTPVAVLTLAKLPSGVTSTPVPAGRHMRNTRMGEGARRQEAKYKNGTATFTYAGREYSLPLDVAGRHSVAPGLYSYENGVRTALLEYGASDDQYLLLRVPVAEGGAASLVPYLVLNGRIVPPIDVELCSVNVEKVQRSGTGGNVDCTAAPRAVLKKLEFSAN
ncbi:MAG TPA: hypothetical protein VGO61_13430 [Steroidobacteraceae bacterium]|nr:hypothetical protein [Steroidobacteraceae bacterium]